MRELSLKHYWSLTDVAMKELATLTALTKFELHDCIEIPVQGLSCLPLLTFLKNLNLVECTKITNVGLSGWYH